LATAFPPRRTFFAAFWARDFSRLALRLAFDAVRLALRVADFTARVARFALRRALRVADRTLRVARWAARVAVLAMLDAPFTTALAVFLVSLAAYSSWRTVFLLGVTAAATAPSVDPTATATSFITSAALSPISSAEIIFVFLP
jgi:hypothetical protein